MLVLSGTDGALDLDQAARRFPQIQILKEPRTGASAARNLALARTEDDIIAFVDDDAVVAPDWADQLSATWTRADLDVACIGGPVRPFFLGSRPSWLGDYALGVLSVLDYGGVERELNPSTHLLYGANMSFRTQALREAGGFDLAVGPSGSGPGFGDDDEAQLAVTARGGRLVYAPDLWVWHLISPRRATRRSIASRRYAYGRSLAQRRQRDAQQAFGIGARAALGILPALARSDQVKAVERAARLAENIGVIRERFSSGPL
jgi:GT2 family glycosyltransferase